MLKVDGAAVDPGLVSLTQNGVEGFLHGEVDQRAEGGGGNDVLELLLWVL